MYDSSLWRRWGGAYNGASGEIILLHMDSISPLWQLMARTQPTKLARVSLRAVKSTNQAMMKRRPIEAGSAKENSLD